MSAEGSAASAPAAEKVSKASAKPKKDASKKSDDKNKAHRARLNSARDSIQREWPDGPRTSVEHYEQVEIAEGRIDPNTFRVFWKKRYKIVHEK
tara:strand:- start:609 stop:890 length:282 start_codon:yes stop_codon:yes gene_type:complete